MKIRLKFQQPKLRLHDLLRRRKLTLDAWLREAGVSTYAGLVRWCSAVGISSPTEEEWEAIRPRPVTAPEDGVVVLDPPGGDEPTPVAPKKLTKKHRGEPTPA